MSLLTGYFLGEMAGSQQEWLSKWQRHRNSRSNGEMTYEEAVQELLRQRATASSTIKSLQHTVSEGSSEIAKLREQVSALSAELAARDALIGEWEQYRDGMERNHTRLRAWSNDAENELKRYHELYGPLPPVQTPDK